MSLRLPTVGGGSPLGRDDEPAALVRPLEERARTAMPILAIASALPTTPAARLAERIVAAACGRDRQVGALVVRRAPHECEVREAGLPDGSLPARLAAAGAAPVRWLRVDPERTAEGLERALDALPPARWVVTVGNDVPALVRPRLTILLTGGAVVTAWSGSARALRDRTDVELADPRRGFAEGLATLL